jgi:hypothetical protein
MSLAIDVDRVAAVLLVDGWHEVAERDERDGRSSFGMDAYEFLEPHPDSSKNPLMHLKGGQEPLVPATGAHWTEPDGVTVFCPVTAILAVKYPPPNSDRK